MSALKQAASAQSIKDIDAELTTLRAKLSATRSVLMGGFRENPNPTEMVGTIKDFRFRMGGLDENPRYTFKLDTGFGMVLWVSCVTDVMTPVMRGMKGKGDNIAKLMNGQMMKVKASVDGPRPVELLEPIGVNDYYAVPLYKGARVISYDNGMAGYITRKGNDFNAWVNFDDFDEPETAIAPDLLIRL